MPGWCFVMKSEQRSPMQPDGFTAILDAGTRLQDATAAAEQPKETVSADKQTRNASELQTVLINRKVATLADLSAIDYDRCRQSEAKALGIRVSTLDVAVTKLRPCESPEADDGLEFLKDPDPWPEPVNGNDLLNDLIELFSTYLVLPRHGALVLALWVLHAHGLQAFFHSPRINIKSPEKGSGKTTCLDILAEVCPRALRLDSVTTATLFRLIDTYQPTMLIDEHDSFLRDNEALRGALNSGHRRGGIFPRCVGDDNTVKLFKVFAATVLAGIGDLPGTLVDRSITIDMKRALPDELKARYDSRKINDDLKRKAARWAADALPQLQDADPEVPRQLFNRVADNWRPLFAIAHVLGGSWEQHTRDAAVSLCMGDTDLESAGVSLLEDIKAYFGCNGPQIKSDNLVNHLSSLEHRPWPEWKKGKPITPRQIAVLLKPFRIMSKTIRFGDTTAKGYEKEAFLDAFSRYLGEPSVTPSQSSIDGASRDFGNVTPDSNVTDEKTGIPLVGAGCYAVTDENGGETGKQKRDKEVIEI